MKSRWGLGASCVRGAAAAVLAAATVSARVLARMEGHAGAVRFYSANVRGFAHLPITVTER